MTVIFKIGSENYNEKKNKQKKTVQQLSISIGTKIPISRVFWSCYCASIKYSLFSLSPFFKLLFSRFVILKWISWFFFFTFVLDNAVPILCTDFHVPLHILLEIMYTPFFWPVVRGQTNVNEFPCMILSTNCESSP